MEGDKDKMVTVNDELRQDKEDSKVANKDGDKDKTVTVNDELDKDKEDNKVASNYRDKDKVALHGLQAPQRYPHRGATLTNLFSTYF